MKKINRLYIVLLIASIYLFGCRNATEYSNKKIITSQILSKIGKYNPILDSPKIKEFEKAYRESTEKVLDKINNNNFLVVERISVRNNNFTIEQFGSYFQGGKALVTYVTNLGDSIIAKEYVLEIKPLKLSKFCDQNYFFLNKAFFPESKYSSYAVFAIEKGYLSDTKIFISDNFDAFNNTQNQCSENDIKEIIRFIDNYPSYP